MSDARSSIIQYHFSVSDNFAMCSWALSFAASEYSVLFSFKKWWASRALSKYPPPRYTIGKAPTVASHSGNMPVAVMTVRKSKQPIFILFDWYAPDSSEENFELETVRFKCAIIEFIWEIQRKIFIFPINTHFTREYLPKFGFFHGIVKECRSVEGCYMHLFDRLICDEKIYRVMKNKEKSIEGEEGRVLLY